MDETERYITDEAVQAALAVGGHALPDHLAADVLAAALPHIAPAIRADEKRKLLGRVEKARHATGLIDNLILALHREADLSAGGAAPPNAD